MKKKIFYSTILFLTVAIFACSFTFAANDNSMLQDAADGVRNVVGGAENAIENAAGAVSNTSKNITGDMQNAGNTISNDDANYTAERTATTTGTNNATFLGMDGTTWIWLIMGLAALGIGILIYSYFNQNTRYEHSDE